MWDHRHHPILEIVLRHTSDAVEITDAEGRFLYVNRAFEELTGYTADQVVGRTPAEMLRSDLHPSGLYEEIWDRVVRRGLPWTGEFDSRRADGTSVYVLCTLQPVRENDRTVAIVALKRPLARFGDVDPAKGLTPSLALAMHAASERRWRAMVTHARDAILVVDHDSGLFVDANPAAEQLTGYPRAELRRMTGRRLSPPEASAELDALAARIDATGRAEHSRLQMLRPDGSRYHASLTIQRFDVDARALHLVVLRNVSEQVEAERKLREVNAHLLEMRDRLLRHDRLAKLGQLSAAIAHEINNPAQWVLATLEVLEQRTAGRPELAPLVADALEGLRRLRAVTAPLLPFVRADDPLGPVDLRDVVRDALQLVGNDLRHRAALQLCLGSAAMVVGHRGRLVQVLTNLLVNAVQAFEKSADERRITVATEADAQGAVLRVADTGCGMSEEQLSRALEPIVKHQEGGTGLGLAVCDEIVRQHGGRLTLESAVGRGTTAVVWLPRAEALRPHARSATPARPIPLQGLRVLVLDDEPLVLRAFTRLLRGCDVVCSSTVADALRLLGEREPFDVILCDLMLPGAHGGEFLERLPPRMQDRVVFCSGGAFGPEIDAFLGRNTRPVLAKPVSLDLLQSTIRSVVQARSGGHRMSTT